MPKKIVKKTAKKVAKKRTVAAKKKTVVRAVRKKVTAAKKKACVCKRSCKPEEAFWINNGPVVKSIAQLKEAFRSMSDEQFAYHTKREGNDFARWIGDCLKDADRAKRLARVKTRAGASRALSMSCCR